MALLDACLLPRPPKPGRKEAVAFELPGCPDWVGKIVGAPDVLAKEWPTPERDESFWLRASTLSYLAEEPLGFSTAGIHLRKPSTGQRVLLTLQDMRFRASRHIGEGVKGATSRFDFRRKSLGLFTPRVYVIGQLLTSGNYASDGLATLDDREASRLIRALGGYLLHAEPSVSAILIKDLWPEAHPAVARLLGRGYVALPSEPVMRLDLTPFDSPDEYLSALSSKYRVRYRRARNKGRGIVSHLVEEEEVDSIRGRMYGLYRLTRGAADVNLTDLTPAYLHWLSGKGRITGYFEGQRLIGFTSLLPNGPVWQAHFLGMEPAYKRSHHLYHNMLCDMLETSLEAGASVLDMGRTAAEIKSSLGARPIAYANLVYPRSKFLRRLLPSAVPAFFREPEWQPRHPFRSRAFG